MRTVPIGTSRLTLLQADITHLGHPVGAIVNAANEQLLPGGGVCGAIHAAAGPGLEIECRWIGHVDTGKAVATEAGNLNADYVIHAVRPVWLGGGRDEDRLLASAYRSSLTIAEERGCTSIAFPSISTGIFGYPVDRAATVAIGTITAYLRRGSLLEQVTVVLFSPDDYAVYDGAVDRWQRTQAERAQAGQRPPMP
jgi:O-acetyl-ADP-ribose deacetylase (regulator of RNase III)